MNFTLTEAMEVLARTPHALAGFLPGLSAAWLNSNEGPDTWNVAEVVEHLIECERVLWIPRLESMLHDGDPVPLPAFDRFAHLGRVPRPVAEQVQQFQALRQQNLDRLQELIVGEPDLERTGLHPEFGVVSARQLLSTWAVHDLTHLAQIARVMAKRYETDVGPWKAYLSILKH